MSCSLSASLGQFEECEVQAITSWGALFLIIYHRFGFTSLSMVSRGFSPGVLTCGFPLVVFFENSRGFRAQVKDLKGLARPYPTYIYIYLKIHIYIYIYTYIYMYTHILTLNYQKIMYSSNLHISMMPCSNLSKSWRLDEPKQKDEADIITYITY